MIIRIVKMSFREEEINKFKAFFEERKKEIRNQKGCTHLELLQDINSPGIIFTYSYWESEEDLNNYRQTEFFRDTWKNTKALFSNSPEAWSVEQISKV